MEREHLEDTDTDETIILLWIIKEIGCEDLHWDHLARDRVQWRAFVNMVMKLRAT
jgi:hypothetical protein